MAVNRVNTPSPGSAESAAAKAAAKSEKAAKAAASRGLDRTAAPGSADPTATRAEISTRAKDMAAMKSAAAGAPDVREDRVSDLKRRIAAGEYQVDPEALAERILKDHASAGIG